jgi:DNA-binding transcriptional ArsR family regulator
MQTSKRKSAPRRPVGCREDLTRLLTPRLFKALGDPSRIGLLARLAWAAKPCTVSEMASGASLDVSVVSRHLAILRDAGIIECVKRGKEVLCSVRAATLAQTLRALADALEACCPGDAQCCAAVPHEKRKSP